MPTSARYTREIPQRYRLEADRCTNCGTITFPPRQVCPSCKGREFEPTRLANEGTLVTHTVIRVPPSQFVDQAPYAVGIVELDDGVRVMAQVVDTDVDTLQSGQRMKVEFRRIQEDGEAGILCYGYKFVPA
jgi:uncharacterized OB-fold protein